MKKVFEAIPRDNRVSAANQRDFFGRCPLHIAVMTNSAQCVKVLLANGARPEFRLPDGRSALHLCAQYGVQTSIVQDLLKRGKEIYDDEQKEKQEEEKGKGQKKEKAEDDDGDAMDVDEEAEKAKEEAEESEGEQFRPFSMTEFLHNKGYGKQKQLSPMAFAVLCGQLELVKELVKYGAQADEKVLVPTVGYGSSKKRVSLLMLVKTDIKIFVQVLIEAGANPCSFTGLFINTYHLCAKYGRTELLKAILEVEATSHGERLTNALDTLCYDNNRVSSPLTLAIEQGHLEAAKLFAKYGAKIQPDKKTCDKARLKATNMSKKKMDWSLRQGLRALTDIQADSFMSPIWRVVTAFANAVESGAKGNSGGRGGFGSYGDHDDDDEYDYEEGEQSLALYGSNSDSQLKSQQLIFSELKGLRAEIEELNGKKKDGRPKEEIAKEKKLRVQQLSRLLVKDRLQTVTEILIWLVKGKKMDINGKALSTEVNRVGSIYLFQDIQSNQKAVNLSPVDFILSLVAQVLLHFFHFSSFVFSLSPSLSLSLFFYHTQ